MKRKWRSLSMALVLAIIVFGPVAVNPPPVEAAWNGVIMAGRVLRSVNPNTSGCRGTAYGRVDGNLVLFLANQCKEFGEQYGNDMPFGPAYTDGGVQIGWWGNGTTIACHCPTSWENNDLTYITLDVNSVWYPSSGRNQVYRGSVWGDDYWHITTNPTSSDGCAGFPAGGAYPDSSYRMWQSTMTSTTPYEFAESLDGWGVTGLRTNNDGCLVFTTFLQHTSPCCDSSTPIMRWSDKTTINGFMTGYNDAVGAATEGSKTLNINGVRALYFNPLYEGLDDLNTYMVANSLHLGAWLCQTGAC